MCIQSVCLKPFTWWHLTSPQLSTCRGTIWYSLGLPCSGLISSWSFSQGWEYSHRFWDRPDRQSLIHLWGKGYPFIKGFLVCSFTDQLLDIPTSLSFPWKGKIGLWRTFLSLSSRLAPPNAYHHSFLEMAS